MGNTTRLGSFLLLGLFAPAVLLAAPAPGPIPVAALATVVPLPAGIADSSGRTGYFASADGGIEAIELATGKVMWATHEAQRPLFVDGDHLLVQAGVKRNRLRILRLNLSRNGECDLESDPVVFPAWVVTGEAAGCSFSPRWRLVKHQLVLEWEASSWYVGNTRPTPDQEKSARKHADGVAVIDLRTGQVEVCPSAKTLAKPLPALPEHLETKSVRWRGLIEKNWKVLALEEKDGQQQFALHTWDRHNKKAQEPKVLFKGKRLVVRVTLDERVLCLHEASPSPDERGSLTPRKSQSWWWLFSARTGDTIGHIPDEAGMHALVVLNKRVFYLVPGPLRGRLDQPSMQPLTLKAIDLLSGKKLWERPVAGKLLAPPTL